MKKFLPYVKVHSTKKYFELPLNQRQKWGLYLKPVALPSNLFDANETDGWEAFSREIRKHYPIQGFIREWLFDMDNPVYAWFVLRKMTIREYYNKVRRFISPEVPRWRASYKRHEYKDIREHIADSNFALILDFWYGEVKCGYINWNSDDSHKEFYNSLESAVKWIETDREKMQLEIETEYLKKTNSSDSYQQKYSRIDELEKLIHDTDTYHLKWMIDYRQYFWT